MATIIPSRPRGRPGKAYTAFHRMLKTLPDEFTAWLSLENDVTHRPHVLLVWRDRHAFLIQIAETSQDLAEAALQPDFFQAGEELTPDAFGRIESDVLRGFLERAMETLGPWDGALPLLKLVIFPNVEEGTVEEIMLHRSDEADVHYLGARRMQPEHFARRIEALASAAMPDPVMRHLRSEFTPESVVPAEFTMRAAFEEHSDRPPLPADFLDIDQEWCVKNDLDLTPVSHLVEGAQEGGVRLITGVAGSGKSLVLLYRALLSARLHPDARVLVLTHNRPLRHELERRAKRLEKPLRNLECMTFFQWASRCIGPWKENTWSPREIENTIARLKDARPSLARLSTAFLVDEIGWIKDQRLLSSETYLAADRTGRGAPLRGSQPMEMWRLFEDYQNALATADDTDWHNIALRFHDAAVIRKTLPFPVFDAILVDEAQFFAKVWFDVVQAALRPGGHLFLAADPTQGFLRRRQSWISAGIEVRGRTTRLAKPYRNTRAILRFARQFYESRSAPDEAETGLNVPDDEQISTITIEGEQPVLIEVESDQSEIARAVHEVTELKKRGLPSGNLLILHAHSPLEPALRKALVNRLGENAVHDAKLGMQPDGAFCSLTTLAAATGLEAPVVMLLGISRLIDSEDDPRLGETGRAEAHRDHTRMIYMGLTRAGQRLIVIARNNILKKLANPTP